jgi:hypothetical protein
VHGRTLFRKSRLDFDGSGDGFERFFGPLQSAQVQRLVVQGSGEVGQVGADSETEGEQAGQSGIPGPVTAGDVVIATDGHPFWVPDLEQWVDAIDLTPGMWLQTSAGTWVQVSAVQTWTQAATVHNLTVQGVHTFHVAAGDLDVLNHNCDPSSKTLPSRNAAFREAKRDLGIPNSQQPESLRKEPMADRSGRRVLNDKGIPVETREYSFTGSNGDRVIIQDHSAGHSFGGGGVGDQGPHFNVRPFNNPRAGRVPGTAGRYEY